MKRALIVLILAGIVIGAVLYLFVLVLQFLVTGQAARNHGKSFVTTVLAIKAAGA